ncbi:response regulator [Pleurocapsa sp. PCC 7319]|uniref:response regulator n=1 Tax=Pleurocapsa sp. PCC 7319 TaxID=118161 RepID=UPI000344A54D|nr:response regulator [Pleurocapsa sp. PCC 7319]
MSSQKYEANQLNSILESLFKEKANGILSLKSQVPARQNQRSCILMLNQGALVYGDNQTDQIPNNQEFCKMLGDKLKPNIINAALSVASERISKPTSVRELIELLTKMKIFTWEEVETFITIKVTLILEQFLSHPGEAHWQSNSDFDLSFGTERHGLNWFHIKQKLNQRQQQWQSLAPKIPSMDAIPIATLEQFKQINNFQVQEHFKNSVDGKRSIVDIAEKMGKDPLSVAKSYLNWLNNGWVSLQTQPLRTQAVIESQAKTASSPVKPVISVGSNQIQDSNNLPIVLSVDDSPIIQTTIKRALNENYNVLLADKATEALKILNQKPVKLLLLDLTMPDVDGLEFCKTIRKIPKFKDLPIIMVTARDGLVNKMKGHIAGTSKYLTKPFKPDELKEIVHQYISK